MDLQKLNLIFSEFKEFKKYKFDKFVEYATQTNMLDSEGMKEWIIKRGIKTEKHLKLNYPSFIEFITAKFTNELNSARLAIHLVKKKKLQIRDIIKNKGEANYLYAKWLDSLPIVDLNYSSDPDYDNLKHSKLIKKKANLQFTYFKNLKKGGNNVYFPKGFEVYIVKDDLDFFHVVDNGTYKKIDNTKVYGGSVEMFVDSDFKDNIYFSFLKDKEVSFVF